MDVTVLVRELRVGGELFAFLQNGDPFSEAVARTYCRQLLDALIHIHRHGVSRLQITPESVIVNEDSSLRVAGFGGAVVEADPAAVTLRVFRTVVVSTYSPLCVCVLLCIQL